jgi:hypothetical protein
MRNKSAKRGGNGRAAVARYSPPTAGRMTGDAFPGRALRRPIEQAERARQGHTKPLSNRLDLEAFAKKYRRILEDIAEMAKIARRSRSQKRGGLRGAASHSMRRKKSKLELIQPEEKDTK